MAVNGIARPSRCPTRESVDFPWADLPPSATIDPLEVVRLKASHGEKEMAAGKHGSRGRPTTGSPETHLLGMQSLVSNKLYDVEGNFVGKLEEIVLDVRTGCVRHVIVAVGGFLGVGKKRFAVPWSALQPDANYCRAVIDLAQMRLTAVAIPDDDPWLRHPASASLATVGLSRIDRAIGTAD